MISIHTAKQLFLPQLTVCVGSVLDSSITTHSCSPMPLRIPFLHVVEYYYSILQDTVIISRLINRSSLTAHGVILQVRKLCIILCSPRFFVLSLTSIHILFNFVGKIFLLPERERVAAMRERAGIDCSIGLYQQPLLLTLLGFHGP